MRPGCSRMVLPQAVRIGDAHLQDAAVAVDVLDGEALDLLLVVRIRPRARADPFRLVGERPFGAVRIDPRAEVERARVERARDVGILAVLRDERVQEVEVRGRRRDLGRMDVAVDPERGLFGGGTGRGVGDRQHPDVAAFVALADRFDRDELRIFGGEGLQERGEFGVAIEAVEGDGGHCGLSLYLERPGCRAAGRHLTASSPRGPRRRLQVIDSTR